MKEKELTVSDLIKRIESGEGKEIKLKGWQLAQLFGVYESAIRANVRAIFRSGIIIPCSDSEAQLSGNVLIPESFDLKMIILLVLRIHSQETAMFRQWITGKVICKTNKNLATLLKMDYFQSN